MAGEGEVRAMQETANSALKLLLEIMRMQRESRARQSNATNKEETLKPGGVNHNELKAAADKKGETVSYQEGISDKYLPKIFAKAEDYGTSVAVVPGNNADGNFTLAFRAKDKEAFQHIISEIVKEEMAVRPRDYSGIPLRDWEVPAMQAEINNGNVPAAIVQRNDGDYSYFCVYENSDKPKIDEINKNFTKAHTEITEKFNFKESNNSYVLQDKSTGRQINLNKSDVHSFNDIINRLTKDFGYNQTKATMAAWYFAGSLPAEKQQDFFEINAFTEVKLKNENAFAGDYSLYRLNEKSSETDKFITVNKEGQITVFESVEALLKKHTELKEIFSENEIEVSPEFEINREIGGTFTVKLGDVEKQYTLNDDSIAALQEDFGISEEKANTLYEKACEQNAVEEQVEQELVEEVTEEVEVVVDEKAPEIEIEELEIDFEEE